MKKILGLLSMLIVIFTLCLCMNINVYASSESDTEIKVSTVTQNGETIINGYVYVSFKGSTGMVGTATIHYATQDMTAIASNGDYEGVSGVVTLSKNNPEQTVPIKVNTSKFSVCLESKTNKELYGKGVTKSFNFLITQFFYSNGSIDKTKLEINLAAKYSYNADYDSGTGLYTFTDYIDAMKNRITYEWGELEVPNSPSSNNLHLQYNYNSDRALNWLNKYSHAKLADIYVGFELKNPRTKSLADWGDFIVWLEHAGYAGVDYIYLDIGVYSFKEKVDYTFSDQINSREGFSMVYGDSHYDYNGSKSAKFNGINLTRADAHEATLYNMKTDLHFENKSALQSSFYCNPVQTAVLVDDVAPHPTSLKGLANDVTYTDDKIKVAVTFNEPVQIKDENKDSLYARIKMASQVKAFKYLEGSGTDTLVFAIDRSDAPALTYDEIELTGFYSDAALTHSTNEIYDFAFENHKVDMSKSIKGETEFDFSNPTFDVSTSRATAVVSGRTFHVETKNINTGTLFYLFSDSKTLAVESTANISEYLAQYQSSILIEKNSPVVYFSSTDKDGNLLNGKKYLHLYLLSSNGNGCYLVDGSAYSGNLSKIEPYYFDSTPPSIDNLEITNNSIQSKTFSIAVSDPEYSSGLKSITIDGLKTTSPLTLNGIWNKGQAMVNSFTITKDDINIGANEYGFYSVTVTVTDIAENSTSYTFNDLYFDTRDVFNVKEEIKDGTSDYSPIITTYRNEKLYELTDDLTLNYTINDPTITGTLVINYLKYGDVVVVENNDIKNQTIYDKIVDSTNKGLIKPDRSGRLEIIYGLEGVSGSASAVFSNYFTNEYEDEVVNGTNILNRDYIKNYLYVLGNKTYSYMTNAGSVETTNYTSDGSNAVFSNEAKAYEFVKFYELQDMKVIHLDSSTESSNIIKWLRTRQHSTGYSAALNDNTEPKANQYWVRYKESTWNGESDSVKWAYYYLSDVSPVIDPAHLPDALEYSLKMVTERITKTGKYQYFTGRDYVDGNGYPNILSTQIVGKNIVASVSKCGATYKYNLEVEKDKNLFDGIYHYSVTNKDIMYLMHYYADITTDPSARIFYSFNGSEYKQVNLLETKELDSLLTDNATGIFNILELGENGARKYDVYIDRRAPIVKIRCYQTEDANEVITLSASVKFYWRNIHINYTQILNN